MDEELLKIFDQNRNEIGVASRAEVHQKGLWHESFHCWFVHHDKDAVYLYLQLRSPRKKEHGNLFDITAAGHLLAHETVRDGVREIGEELGIDVSFEELVSLGQFDYCVSEEQLIDNEMAHLFLYRCEQELDGFSLQEEEVSGMIKVEFPHFRDLWRGKRETVRVFGYEIKPDGEKCVIDQEVGRDRFVPHQLSYYEAIIQKIAEKL
ncbi:NUDIX hydrolase [Neobacillus jeddahensis]|uniref:NUDIX hydrolase n=1 Tax=Neobacillus jeddahensis TaxID=1461580 RepID=UPI00059119D2|nr:NUDIX domain-containing protein [Neobacillus jeddahensis]